MVFKHIFKLIKPTAKYAHKLYIKAKPHVRKQVSHLITQIKQSDLAYRIKDKFKALFTHKQRNTIKNKLINTSKQAFCYISKINTLYTKQTKIDKIKNLLSRIANPLKDKLQYYIQSLIRVKA